MTLLSYLPGWQAGCEGVNAVVLCISKENLERSFSWATRTVHFLSVFNICSLSSESLGWRSGCYLELSIPLESCFAAPLLVHLDYLPRINCSDGHGLCGYSGSLCHGACTAIFLAAKAKSSKNWGATFLWTVLSCCVCLSSARVLPSAGSFLCPIPFRSNWTPYGYAMFDI